MPLSFPQLEKMFTYNFRWESKIRLLIMHLDSLKYEEVVSLAHKLTSDHHYSTLFQTRKRPTFEKNQLNKELFTKLLDKNYIGSFDINPKNDNEFRVMAKY